MLRMGRARGVGHVWRPGFWRAARILSAECPVVELGEKSLESDMCEAVEEAAKEANGDESEVSLSNGDEMDVDVYSGNR